MAHCEMCPRTDGAVVAWSDHGHAHRKCINETMEQARHVAAAMQATARKRKE